MKDRTGLKADWVAIWSTTVETVRKPHFEELIPEGVTGMYL